MKSLSIPSAREQYIPQLENAFKIAVLLCLLLACFEITNSIGTYYSHGGQASWFLAVLLAGIFIGASVLASMVILALAILAHDGVHRVLFRNVFINDLISGLLSALCGFVPFYANRQIHLTHHSYAHQGKEDPEHEMHNRPFWLAATVGSFIGIYLHQRMVVKNLLRGFSEGKYLLRALKDIGFILAAILIYVAVIRATGIDPLFSIAPAFLAFMFTFGYRAVSDHYGLARVKRKSEQYKEVLENSDSENEKIMQRAHEQISGWVVRTNPLMEWLWSHVNYHEVHHKFPYLSHIHLPAAYEASKDRYPYREVQGYTRSFLQLSKKTYYQE